LLSALKLFNDFFDVLGLKIEVTELSKDDKDVYLKWIKARKEKDFDSADTYRDILSEKGII